MRGPKVSVIVPIYCVAAFIEECLGSILAQSMGDFELLLVDDASPDDSMERCRRLAKGDGRVRFLRNERNLGLSGARNRGIREARGEYIAFVDGDDFIGRDYLSRLLDATGEGAADVVSMGFTEYVPQEGRYLPGRERIFAGERSFLIRDPRIRMESMMAGEVNGTAWGKLCRRELFLRWDLRFENIVSEDVLFHFRLLYLAENYIILPDTLYCYRRSPGSITRGSSAEKALCALRSNLLVQRYVNRYLEGMPEIREDSLLSSRIRNYFADIFWNPVFFNAAVGLPFRDLQGPMGELFSEFFPEEGAFVFKLFREALKIKIT